ncbi:hypothetical protein CSA_011910 [Cucumis sativus]|uniref:Uncharacterized protein n=1 Tax=Cucumis sativus TaxID=3659 RepID=A0ACB6HBY0_CUCSA|nr:hypothetical protein CSA_011910 [Cucumis sativus]
MSEKFSATLRIGDLNDFIAPSQACIVSLKGLKATATKPDKVEVLFRFVVPIAAKAAGHYMLSVSASRMQLKAEPVKISLKDCLACSGCVTSAETVMLEKQSLDEFLSNLNKGKVVIVSLSPQSRASLAVHFGISPLKVFKKLTTFFKSMGVKAIFDTSCSRDLTLIEACNEFIARYRNSQQDNEEKCKSSVPMISSACPGWICYAEKQHGSYILPYISSVKSPQQMIGSIVKHHMCQKLGIRSDDVYHVTVMPCYDKKLEAAREDFVFQLDSATKLWRLRPTESQKLTNVNEEGHLFGVSGSSGGYAETIFRHAAKILFGKDIEGPLEFKLIRNSDFQELTLEVLMRDPFDNPVVKEIYKEWLEEPGSEKAKKHLHTEYHPVVKSITAQLHNCHLWFTPGKRRPNFDRI